ncbi:unnamed protein product, partial [Medioppia subpectinata]
MTAYTECRFNKTGVSGLIHHKEIPAELQNYSIAQEISLDCMWNITVLPGYKMYLNFNEYRLNNPNNCEANYIEVTQAESVRSKTNVMHIRFFAKHDALQNVNFEITYTAFRELSSSKEKCRPNEFDCEDSTCIDKQLKCDGYFNCKYRYDEDKTSTCAPDTGGIFNFTSQHMVVILVVFCALVLGMCASITISCWSKIQERRQRKRDYKLRRSRETSVEVGLDRTMTITSLDRGDRVLEQEIAAQQQVLGSGGRTRKIITANAITRKGGYGSGGRGGTAIIDDDMHGCYVPDVDVNVYRKQPNGGPHQQQQQHLLQQQHMHQQQLLMDDKFSPDS